MSIQFDIEELRTFVILAENGHFTETARVLGISQPAVSQRIARLENSFGLMLFSRSAERAVLTDYGQMVLPGAMRCVESHAAMANRLKEPSPPRRGSFRIWIDRSLFGGQLEASLLENLPEGLSVESLQLTRGEGWVEKLTNNECDLAVSGVFLLDHLDQKIEHISLKTEPGLTAMWSTDYHEIPDGAFNLSRLSGTRFLIGSERLVPGFRKFVEDWFRRAYGRASSDLLEFDSFQDVLEACETGLGIALLPGTSTNCLTSPSSRIQSRHLFGEVLPEAYIYGLHVRKEERREGVAKIAARIVSIFRRSNQPHDEAPIALPYQKITK